MAAADRLKELQDAAGQYFESEKARIEAEFDFLDAILKKRGGSQALQAQNTAGAQVIFENSIDDYLGRP